jgi:hypothetical protein
MPHFFCFYCRELMAPDIKLPGDKRAANIVRLLLLKWRLSATRGPRTKHVQLALVSVYFAEERGFGHEGFDSHKANI